MVIKSVLINAILVVNISWLVYALHEIIRWMNFLIISRKRKKYFHQSHINKGIIFVIGVNYKFDTDILWICSLEIFFFRVNFNDLRIKSNCGVSDYFYANIFQKVINKLKRMNKLDPILVKKQRKKIIYSLF